MRMKNIHHLPLLLATAALAAGALNASGNLLSLIPTLANDTANEGRAITPDGLYVVGLSGSRGFLYSVGSPTAVNILSSDGAQSQIATGVGYRTSGGNTELIMAGMSSGYVTEWMTTDGSTFGAKRRDTTFAYNVMPSANSLGAGLGSDAYFVTSYSSSAATPVYLNKLAGAWVPTITYSSKGISSPDSAGMNGVSASGRAVGWRVNTSIKKNYMLTWTGSATPANAYFNGLDGTQAGQAFSVSADGLTVFGQSPKVGNTSYFGYKVVNPGASQVINALPLFGDEAGSISLQVPYGCTTDGRFAVGMDYRGAERAVLWDTSSSDPTGWKAYDLTDLANSQGILDGWTRLTRAYSVGLDAAGECVITGVGSWSPDGGVTSYTRGFVMVVPEPAGISLLALGGLVALSLRRRK